jgi:uncharacterized protein YqhQ
LPATFHYGGQAVIEGVMMRGQTSVSIAVRRPNREIDLTTKPLPSISKGRLHRIPLLRGVVILAESLVLGIQALFHSANVSIDEEDEEIPGILMWGVLAFSLIFAISLFFAAPVLLVEHVIEPRLESHIAVRTIEHVIRIVMFVAYLAAINLIPSVRSVFAYHGAEHKTINAYEDGAPMEVEAIRKYSTAHLRCGTSFLLAVLVIAILLFVLVDILAPDLERWQIISSRIVLVPVIAGLAYEVTRFSANYSDNRLIRAFFIPGLALQALTTREPDDSQIEVAMRALEKALQDDGVQQVRT